MVLSGEGRADLIVGMKTGETAHGLRCFPCFFSDPQPAVSGVALGAKPVQLSDQLMGGFG